jgi:hypothetical protein
MTMRREVSRRVLGALVVAPLVVMLGLAGCGKGNKGEGVATVSGAGAGGASPKPTATVSVQDAMLKFAQCMRDHGIDMKDPDIDGDGNFGIQIGGPGKAGTPANKEKVDAAMEACKQYMPNGGEPPKANPEMAAKMQKMAECMRANGVPTFPDPDPETGGIMIQGEPGGALDPMSPTFKAAQSKCNKEAGLPDGGGKLQEGTDGGGASLNIHTGTDG